MNVLELLDRPIAYHRVFVTLTGSVKAAILLSQALYWQKRAKQKDGWWYKTAEEWQEETGLTRHEQDTARKACEKYLKTDLRDSPARLYWKIDEEKLSGDLIQFGGKRQTKIDENRQTSLAESGKQVSRFPSNINRNAEITTETTQRGRENPPLNFRDMTIPQARKVPTLRMFEEATGWFPADILWEQVHETITKHGLTSERIRAAALAWVGKGYKRGNVAGILEWAVNGVPADRNTPVPAVEAPDPFEAIKKLAARQEARS